MLKRTYVINVRIFSILFSCTDPYKRPVPKLPYHSACIKYRMNPILYTLHQLKRLAASFTQVIYLLSRADVVEWQTPGT